MKGQTADMKIQTEEDSCHDADMQVCASNTGNIKSSF